MGPIEEYKAWENSEAKKYNTDFARSLRNQGYNVSTLSYPEGLGIKPDLQHYVAFFINTRSKTKGNYNTLPNITPTPSGGRRDTIDVSSNKFIEKGAVVAGAAGTIAAVGRGLSSFGTEQGRPKLSALFSAVKSAGVAGAVTAATYGGAIAATSAATNYLDILKSDNKARLTDVITLHVEERPSVKYGVNYQDKDLGVLGNFLTSNEGVSDLLSGNTPVAAAAALQVAKIPSMIPGFGTSLADIVTFGAKVKTNPFREVFFEGVDYRQFNFRYRFLPKNANESKAVKGIIDTFKLHMHPELAANGYFYLYPSEFEIVYYYNNQENNYFNKIAPCALTDMTVEYGGEQFASFADGSPAEISLTLSFRELELLTKESITKMGY